MCVTVSVCTHTYAWLFRLSGRRTIPDESFSSGHFMERLNCPQVCVSVCPVMDWWPVQRLLQWTPGASRPRLGSRTDDGEAWRCPQGCWKTWRGCSFFMLLCVTEKMGLLAQKGASSPKRGFKPKTGLEAQNGASSPKSGFHNVNLSMFNLLLKLCLD